MLPARSCPNRAAAVRARHPRCTSGCTSTGGRRAPPLPQNIGCGWGIPVVRDAYRHLSRGPPLPAGAERRRSALRTSLPWPRGLAAPGRPRRTTSGSLREAGVALAAAVSRPRHPVGPSTGRSRARCRRSRRRPGPRRRRSSSASEMRGANTEASPSRSNATMRPSDFIAPRRRRRRSAMVSAHARRQPQRQIIGGPSVTGFIVGR